MQTAYNDELFTTPWSRASLIQVHSVTLAMSSGHLTPRLSTLDLRRTQSCTQSISFKAIYSFLLSPYSICQMTGLRGWHPVQLHFSSMIQIPTSLTFIQYKLSGLKVKQSLYQYQSNNNGRDANQNAQTRTSFCFANCL